MWGVLHQQPGLIGSHTRVFSSFFAVVNDNVGFGFDIITRLQPEQDLIYDTWSDTWQLANYTVHTNNTAALLSLLLCAGYLQQIVVLV